MSNLIKRHALLFTLGLGAVVALVLVVLLRQKKTAASSTSTGSTTGSSSTTGDAGLTAGYAPDLTENITNIYGQPVAPTTVGNNPTSGPGTVVKLPAGGGPVVKFPVRPIIAAAPAASGAPTISSGAVYSAGRVPAEGAHTPVRLGHVVASAGAASRAAVLNYRAPAGSAPAPVAAIRPGQSRTLARNFGD